MADASSWASVLKMFLLRHWCLITAPVIESTWGTPWTPFLYPPTNKRKRRNRISFEVSFLQSASQWFQGMQMWLALAKTIEFGMLLNFGAFVRNDVKLLRQDWLPASNHLKLMKIANKPPKYVVKLGRTVQDLVRLRQVVLRLIFNNMKVL